jgi:hypothetical protein
MHPPSDRIVASELLLKGDSGGVLRLRAAY